MHYGIVKKDVPQMAVPNNQQCSFDIFAHGDVSRFLLWARYMVTLSSWDAKPDKTASNMHIIKSTVLQKTLKYYSHESKLNY